MGMVEDGTEQVGKVIDTLRGAPMLLSLVILNLSVLAMLTYLLIKVNETRFAERGQIIEILSQCLKREISKDENK